MVGTAEIQPREGPPDLEKITSNESSMEIALARLLLES